MSNFHILSHTITHPDNENYDVERPWHMPGMEPEPNNPGRLCGVINGTVAASGYLYEILIRCKKGTWQSTNPAHPDDYISNDFCTQGSETNRLSIPVNQFINGSYDWNAAGVGDVLAFGNDGVYVPNTIMAVARFFGGSDDGTSRNFQARWLGDGATCPPRLATALPPEHMFHPTQHDGAWLLYENLPVSAIGNGNLLSLHGAPLRAKELAISAARVHWWSNLPHGVVVRRPVGEDLCPTGSASPFRGLPRSAIVIHQPQRRHVLMSESRNKPDLVELDRDQNFRIQVNFESPILPTAGLLGGSYDLWVKVLQ